MRKLLTLLLVLVSMAAFGQYQQSYKQQQTYYVPNPWQTSSINITHDQVTNGWARNGNACAGCASYFYKITRTSQMIYAEDGNSYYYYYIWFFTNSYYSNGSVAATYLSGVNAYVDGQYVTGTSYALVSNQENYYIWIRTQDPNSRITFQVSQMSVY